MESTLATLVSLTCDESIDAMDTEIPLPHASHRVPAEAPHKYALGCIAYERDLDCENYRVQLECGLRQECWPRITGKPCTLPTLKADLTNFTAGMKLCRDNEVPFFGSEADFHECIMKLAGQYLRFDKMHNAHIESCYVFAQTMPRKGMTIVASFVSNSRFLVKNDRDRLLCNIHLTAQEWSAEMLAQPL